jgi:hypothetical protein
MLFRLPRLLRMVKDTDVVFTTKKDFNQAINKALSTGKDVNLHLPPLDKSSRRSRSRSSAARKKKKDDAKSPVSSDREKEHLLTTEQGSTGSDAKNASPLRSADAGTDDTMSSEKLAEARKKMRARRRSTKSTFKSPSASENRRRSKTPHVVFNGLKSKSPFIVEIGEVPVKEEGEAEADNTGHRKSELLRSHYFK